MVGARSNGGQSQRPVSTPCPTRVQSPALYIECSLCILIAKAPATLCPLGRSPHRSSENVAKCLKKWGFRLGFSLEEAQAKGPPDWFTGAIRIDPLFQPSDPSSVQGASVTFESGGRTAWHTHLLGQTLIWKIGSCNQIRSWQSKLSSKPWKT